MKKRYQRSNQSICIAKQPVMSYRVLCVSDSLPLVRNVDKSTRKDGKITAEDQPSFTLWYSTQTSDIIRLYEESDRVR